MPDLAPVCWTLNARTAQLRVGELTATLDLTQPRRGLHALQLGSAAVADTSLLGIDLRLASADELSLPETYVRGNDLVAVYTATAARPWRVQAYWRVVEAEAATGAIVVDLQLSINTGLLDVRPAVDVVSSLTTKSQASAEHRVGFALGSSSYDYWQAVHPDDPCTIVNHAPFTQRLFDRFLEKGVILRARVRGAIVPRGTSVDAIFAEFAASPLPLTT